MIRTEFQGSLLLVWLDAPATRNALTDAMVQDLRVALRQAVTRPQLRAVVLRGAGRETWGVCVCVCS
ncbi:MAG: enoyl-CoA hydratase/isomerase family protein [Limnohabitans sp.]